MRPLYLIVAVVVVIVAGLGVLMLGAFPPKPHPQPVDHVVPNDRFSGH